MMKNENGRSMIEMLGVLAIIGVLSVGGIYGYTLAMRKYAANEIVQTASMLATIAKSANAGTGATLTAAQAGLCAANQKIAGFELADMSANGSSGASAVATVTLPTSVTTNTEVAKVIGSIAPCASGDSATAAGYYITNCGS